MDHLFRASIHDPTAEHQHLSGLSQIVGWQDAWVPKLADILKQQGLDEVVRHIIPVPSNLLPPWGHLEVLVMEEHQRGAVAKLGQNHEKVKALDEHLRKWRDEAENGVYTYYDPILVTARKPLDASSG